MKYKYTKRFMDVAIAATGLVLTLPATLPTAMYLLLENKGDVFLKQKRMGRDGKEFTLYKFKTMNDKKSSNGALLPDEERLLPGAHFLRKYALDEFPQFVNVLKSDMSLFGPRPLTKKQLTVEPALLARYPDIKAALETRQSVKPGLCCFNDVRPNRDKKLVRDDWHSRLRLDSFYVENLSLKTDFGVLRDFIKSSGCLSTRDHMGVGPILQEYCEKLPPPGAKKSNLNSVEYRG